MGVSYGDLIERMRWSGRLKNDSAVARALGVTPQALSNYKKRGEMPTDLVLKFANIYNLSVDWLITGQGEMKRNGSFGEGAAEDAAAYGKGRYVEMGAMSPDEIIYIGKLLKIMRGNNKNTAASLKHTLDAFLKVASESSQMPGEGEKSGEPKTEPV